MNHILVCDLDNTLVPCSVYYQQARDHLFELVRTAWPSVTETIFRHALQHGLREAHRDGGYSDTAFEVGCLKTVHILSAPHGPRVVPAAMEQEARHIGRSVFQQAYPLYPGVREALEQVRAAGNRLVLATKGDERMQWKLKILPNGLETLFDHIEVCLHKPPATLQRAFQQGRRSHTDIGWMIGDSLSDDILGGQSVGLRTVWVKPELETTHQDRASEEVVPDFTIDRFADIMTTPALESLVRVSRPVSPIISPEGTPPRVR